MQEFKIGDWEDFVRLAARFDVGPPTEPAYVFRGQADAAWSLKPSLFRHVEALTPQKALEIERVAMDLFRRHAAQHLDAATLPREQGTITWWTLMQHHGAPTRLLDWTASPFVAAYFAAETHFDKPGAIWALHAVSLDQAMANKYGAGDPEALKAQLREPNADQRVTLLRRTTETDRMAAQQTAFTFSTQILTDHLPALSLISEDKVIHFAKVVFPPEQKHIFLRRLGTMNITARSLFPGIDGLGRSVSGAVVQAAAFERGQAPPPEEATENA